MNKYTGNDVWSQPNATQSWIDQTKKNDRKRHEPRNELLKNINKINKGFKEVGILREDLNELKEKNVEKEVMKNMGKEANAGLARDLGDGRFGLEDDKVATKLLDKSFSPMIIRKYTRIGFPLYVHLICDENLDNLDEIVHDCIDFCKENGILSNSIQSLRNFTGILGEKINEYYDNKKRGCVESLGIIFYADKMIISSLQGDCMNHNSCRQELYDSLLIMTQI